MPRPKVWAVYSRLTPCNNSPVFLQRLPGWPLYLTVHFSSNLYAQQGMWGYVRYIRGCCRESLWLCVHVMITVVTRRPGFPPRFCSCSLSVTYIFADDKPIHSPFHLKFKRPLKRLGVLYILWLFRHTDSICLSARCRLTPGLFWSELLCSLLWKVHYLGFL